MSDPGPLELLRALVTLEPQKYVAERYGISPQHLNDVLHQRREISASLADRLGYWRRIVFVKKRPVCDNCPHPVALLLAVVEEKKDHRAELAVVGNDTTVVPAPQLPHAETCHLGRDAECDCSARERALSAFDDSELTRQSAGTWQPITGEMKDGWFVVTNNMKALYRGGLKSHVWMTNFVQAGSAERTGEFICYDDWDRCVRGLTHYQRLNLQPLPAAPSPASDQQKEEA